MREQTWGFTTGDLDISRQNKSTERRKPRKPGLSAFLENSLNRLSQNWHAPCKDKITSAVTHPFWGPWYRQAENPLLYTRNPYRSQRRVPAGLGNPGTGRPGIPSLTPGLITLPATSPTRFGNLGTGRPGIPSLTPGLITLTATSPTRFGNLGTGRPGIPSLHRAQRDQRGPHAFGNLGTGRPGLPLFTPGPAQSAPRPHAFGDLGTGRPGIPSFIPRAAGAPGASARRPRCPTTRRAAPARRPRSAASLPQPPSPASWHPCR